MRLAGQISAAIEVLEDIQARHRPAAAALRDWGLAHRFAGSGDRAAIGNIVYDALRWRRSLAWRLGSDTPRSLALGVIALAWQHDTGDLAEAISADVHGPGELTPDELRRMLEPAPIADAADAVRADIPDWCVPSIRAAFAENWIAEAQALSDRPPLDLRANSLKADRERVLGRLARYNAVACNYSPVGIRIPPTDAARRHPNIQADEAWRRGRVEVQDEGSQLCALLSGAGPGHQVLDLCAGAGGKTLALAAMMENRGQIYAYDADRNRLAAIYDRLKRAGARNVQVRPPDEDALADLAGRMDLVFVDAPCTGSGVWRRHPDAKWRLSEKSLRLRLSEQSAILDKAGQYVRPGGLLVYATCSVFPEENQAQIDGFMRRHPHFRPAALPGSDLVETADGAIRVGHSMQLTPAATETDGFFIAALERA